MLTLCFCIQCSNEVCSHSVTVFSIQMKYAHTRTLHRLLSHFSCSSPVKLFEVIETEKTLYLIMEYASGGEWLSSALHYESSPHIPSSVLHYVHEWAPHIPSSVLHYVHEWAPLLFYTMSHPLFCPTLWVSPSSTLHYVHEWAPHSLSVCNGPVKLLETGAWFDRSNVTHQTLDYTRHVSWWEWKPAATQALCDPIYGSS